MNTERYIPKRRDIMTPVRKLEYDAETRLGKVWLPEGCSPNGAGVIRLFEYIDNEVVSFDVFSGETPLFRYKQKDHRWKVFDLVTISS